MLRAWRGIARFRGQSSYFTWLYRIAVNEANRALEKRARQPAGVSIGRGRTGAARRRAGGPVPAGREQRTAPGAEPRPWPCCRPRCGPRSCCVTSKGSPPRRPRRSPVSARPPSRAALHQARLRVRAAIGDQALVTAAWMSRLRGPSAAGLAGTQAAGTPPGERIYAYAKARERRRGMGVPEIRSNVKALLTCLGPPHC